MVSNEAWMGSGTTVTMAYESELFLGFMPHGPTLGRTGTNKANLIKYSLGYALDGSSVLVENTMGEGNGTVKHFTDYYHLVPDLYTGCTAKFFWTEDSSVAPTLQQTALVAGNDADAIYFAGNLSDFNTLFADQDAAVSSSNRRGYIVLESRGSIIPAPISLETVGTTSSYTGDIEVVTATTGTDLTKLAVDELVYDAVGGACVGKVWAFSANDTALTSRDAYDGTTADDTIHFLSDSLGTVSGASSASNGIGSVTMPTSMTGILTAGDFISGDLNTRTNAAVIGIVTTLSSDGTIVTFAQAASQSFGSGHELYWGRDASPVLGAGLTSISRVNARTLSDNWVGLANTITPPTVEIEMKQVNLALGGTRNYSYQYKGMENAGNANLDLNLNHGSWLYYALGSLSSASSTVVDTDPATNHFQRAGSNASTHEVHAGYDTGSDRDYDGHSQNGKFHRVLKGGTTICPPLMPNTGIAKLTLPDVSNGIGSNLITYTFGERNDNFLPTFGLELTNQKGSTLTTNGVPRTDRNTYSESCYSQLFPGCMVNSLTLTANANEEVKGSLDLNVKRVFECPDGYVAKAFDATNNNTNEFKTLFNFGQQTGVLADVSEARHSLVEPFYFSDGTVSLFGTDFMRIESMTLTINNSVTDKRYIGQYNKQIKMAHPAQRTYELSMTAQVTDRRLFDELRRLSPHRNSLPLETDGTNALIQLLFTKDNGERIKLQFDDYMIGTANFPIPDDRGPVVVDFSIMPLRVGTIDAISGWVMQK